MARWPIVLLASVLTAAVAAPAAAATFRWSAAADAASLDPYSRNETLQLSLLGNVYEPLVRRGADGRLEPALAIGWRRVAPLVWRFDLRPNVRFQDGTTLTANDVVFSYRRAVAQGSKIALALSAIREVRAINERTVDIVTAMPDSILPEEIVAWSIMSATWCHNHGVDAVADPAVSENYATTHADGTGPFRVASRIPGEETVFVPNPDWWGQSRPALERAIFRPITDDAARIAALDSGAIDLVTSVPLEHIDALRREPGLRIAHTAGTQTVFLGFGQAPAATAHGRLPRRNPLADRRVRFAFAQAIDETAIAAAVMRGLATPAGLLVGPGVTGFDAALNRRPVYDPGAARRLLADAGYAGGFALTMDCPDDRYVNDVAICRAVAADLAKIGVRISLRTQSRRAFFTRLLDPAAGSRFYLMGWRPADDDAIDALVNLAATRSDRRHTGAYNVGGYSNPALDDLIVRAGREAVGPQRTALLRAALAMVKEDMAYLPLHQPDVVWAMRDTVVAVPAGNGGFTLRDVRLKGSAPGR